MTYWCLMIRFANLLQAPTVSIYQLVKTITFVLYLFDMVEMNKMEITRIKNYVKFLQKKERKNALIWYLFFPVTNNEMIK